jgi:copper chaperone CopZ
MLHYLQEATMKTISLAINGMHCGHCVSAVKQALESVSGVTVQHIEIGKATLEAAEPAPIGAIKLAVEDAGYFAEVAQG